VQLFGSRSLNRETISPNSRTDSTTVGVEVAIGYNLGGLVSAQVREAIAGEGQADFALQGALLSAEQDTRAAFLNVVGGLAQVSALEAAERSSQLALDSNKLGYEVGVRINIDVLNSQQQLFSAQRDLSRARYETLLSSLRLKAAVGGLQPADLEGISGLMQSK
jgi:outer membrane protein